MHSTLLNVNEESFHVLKMIKERLFSKSAKQE